MTDATEARLKDAGLLVLRLGFGAMFIAAHGLPKVLAGPKAWDGMGQAIGNLGIHFFPAFWGFMAAFSELAGGIAIVLGFYMRPMCVLLAFTMLVAAVMHLGKGDGLGAASHAIECGIVAIALVITGPGRYTLGRFLLSDTSA